jgi:NAD(P)-dependent dehydrogenase (short-subunit alcohol dehydrogenase family)
MDRISAVFTEVHNKYGKLDILVNNAGISGADKPTHEITENEWDTLMRVNVKGVFFCTKHAIPLGAVRLMTKTDALIYAKDNIRVNSIHPGYIWTPMVEHFGAEPHFHGLLKEAATPSVRTLINHIVGKDYIPLPTHKRNKMIENIIEAAMSHGKGAHDGNVAGS